ncbi:lambda exonuclease family protein [Cupriavidus necator]|uniref:lambda exonuclease family protein n=1 Tax=Cupriavidus necator TaxID=106590 RepID=UPI00339D7D5B
MSRYIVSPHPQGTPEWLADRCGKVTGSNVSAVFAKIKSGEAAARADYRMQLVLERLTGIPAEGPPPTAEMRWGTEQEPFARMAYEIATGLTVNESGFCYLPDLMVGCSVDGFIEDGGRAGIWEGKAPKSKTHMAYLDAGELPSIYVPQVDHNLWVTGKEFCDFQSYDPRFPEKLQRFCIRIERDEARIKAHEAAVLQFLAEVDELESKLRQRAA